MDLVENGDLSIIELKLEPLNAAILLIILLVGKQADWINICGSKRYQIWQCGDITVSYVNVIVTHI